MANILGHIEVLFIAKMTPFSLKNHFFSYADFRQSFWTQKIRKKMKVQISKIWPTFWSYRGPLYCKNGTFFLEESFHSIYRLQANFLDAEKNCRVKIGLQKLQPIKVRELSTSLNFEGINFLFPILK